MEMNEYQDAAQETAIYPKSHGLEYTALGLAGEAGEYANKVSKVLRDGGGAFDRSAFIDELGDVLWFLALAAVEVDTTLDWVARRNINKLADRKDRDKLGGSGDER